MSYTHLVSRKGTLLRLTTSTQDKDLEASRKSGVEESM